jgi:adenine deaminase
MSFEIKSNFVDIPGRKIYPVKITVEKGKIASIEEVQGNFNNYVLPGFIDAHVHIESSMLVPSEFARLAAVHGTVATVSDPHEIANVLGMNGIRFMIENGNKVPFKFYFGAPSCVPATPFETAGAEITADDIRELFEKDGLKYLSEMMNYPGVLFNDTSVMRKIAIAKEYGKPIDGHAPGLKGNDAKKYIGAGITTDHECFTLEEALDKVKQGMKILIREGSAAKNFEALHPLIKDYPDMVMFCSDDKHPNDLAAGHINEIVVRALAKGYDMFDVLKCACINPIIHYKLDTGYLRTGDAADFILVNNLNEFKILKTYINGEPVAVDGKSLIKRIQTETLNNFKVGKKQPEDFEIREQKTFANDGVPVVPTIRVIEALDGQLITNELHETATVIDGKLSTHTGKDIIKLAVINRYFDAKPAVAFIKNFGLIKGAMASCVGHDSHNIIAVGVTDSDIADAVNGIVDSKGGISAAYEGKVEVLPLPVAGIMSNEDGYAVAEKYTKLDKFVKELGSKLHAPFMTLSFMALLVIPQLKLSDKGLFDGGKFEFTELFVK